MSLLRIRRDRLQETRGGPNRPPSIWKLVAGLILVVLAIYYLTSWL